MENKFTDNEIINCLNDTEGKEDIGIYCTDKNGNFTTVVKLTDLVDLLNRQKAEIERLQKMKQLIKTEVIKEFAERLKKCETKVFGSQCRIIPLYCIDNLAKEMEGEDGLR